VAVEWEDIEGAAAKMFNVWTSGGDLAFAKEAWSHLAAAGLTEDYSLVARTETYLRLIAVRLIYGEFCKTKWDEDAEDEIVFLAEGLDFDALGLLAAPHMDGGGIEFEEQFDLFEAALTASSAALRPEVFECLQKAHGGDNGLYMRLCRTADNSDESDQSDFDLTGNNLSAFSFIEQGGQF
jgi:hypothetical protein